MRVFARVGPVFAGLFLTRLVPLHALCIVCSVSQHSPIPHLKLLDVRNGNLSALDPSRIQRWQSSMRRFLTVQLEAAKTFLTVAGAPSNLDGKARYVQHARQAFEAVLRFSAQVPMTRPEKERIESEMDDLRCALQDWERVMTPAKREPGVFESQKVLLFSRSLL